MGEHFFPEAHTLALSALEPRFCALFSALGPIKVRLRPTGYSSLLKLIVEQQLSVKAADTIWGRLESRLGEVQPKTLLNLAEEDLRQCGLSRPKIAYARALSDASLAGHIDFERLPDLDIEAATKSLMAIKGIGRWSAEVYLMFCEGREDLFPVGDVALREALAWFDGLESRPDEAWCIDRTAVFAPYRSLASHTLCAWYGAVKRGDLPRGRLMTSEP